MPLHHGKRGDATLSNGTQLHYIVVNTAHGKQWLASAEQQLITPHQEHAKALPPDVALATYRALVKLGYSGISIANNLHINAATPSPAN